MRERATSDPACLYALLVSREKKKKAAPCFFPLSFFYNVLIENYILAIGLLKKKGDKNDRNESVCYYVDDNRYT